MSEIPVHGAEAGWAGSVAFATGPDPFAYRPGEIVVGGERGRDEAQRMIGSTFNADPELVFDETDEAVVPGQLYLLRAEVDAVLAAEELRLEGVVAQPNHVLFSHGCECCGPHPAERWASGLDGGLAGSPVYAKPVYAKPVYAKPVYAKAVAGSPVYAKDLQATGKQRSSALPALPPPDRPRLASMARVPRVAVLDTGMAADGLRPRPLDPFAPAQQHWEQPDVDGDQQLDPAAGHGTFIAGLIDLVTPGCDLTVEKVLSSYGEGDEVAIARRIHALAGQVDLINVSLGGYSAQTMHALAAAVRRATRLGTVVVASAGNEGTCRRTYPAALPDVVSVGAIGPEGPAAFSNYGPWVRACAPGVDIVSWFFTEFRGPLTAAGGAPDPDDFQSWAEWSGTSFSAPMVTAALARYMATFDVDAAEAVRHVVDGPGLMRIPDLGTVVNID
jgi:subtilisin family serine protease